MSTYTRETKHPDTGEWEDAIWYDDLLGKHHYGVVFPSDRENQPDKSLEQIAFDPERVELETRDNTN